MNVSVSNPKLTNSLRKKIAGPFRVKCMSCRRTADGKTINEAHMALDHHPSCGYNHGQSTFFDSIDLGISANF